MVDRGHVFDCCGYSGQGVMSCPLGSTSRSNADGYWTLSNNAQKLTERQRRALAALIFASAFEDLATNSSGWQTLYGISDQFEKSNVPLDRRIDKNYGPTLAALKKLALVEESYSLASGVSNWRLTSTGRALAATL